MRRVLTGLRLTALLRCRRGATAVEFAIILPLLLLFVIGSIEMAINLFIGSSIEAAVMEASRFGITGSEPGVSRAEKVLGIVEAKTYGLLDMDQVEMDTLVYASFADIGQPEPFVDQDGNDAYNTGEPFTDVNGNGTWDEDMGEAGLGGPSDVVVYRLSYDWGIVTPMLQEVLGASVRHMSSVAVRNEPF
jgi:Flp pilus assembly pilin Flp